MTKELFRKCVQDLIAVLAGFDGNMSPESAREAAAEVDSLEYIDFEYDTFRHFDQSTEFDFWFRIILSTAETVYNGFFIG